MSETENPGPSEPEDMCIHHPEGRAQVEAWGITSAPAIEREFAFLTGPDSSTGNSYPNDVISLGNLLKMALDQLGPLWAGKWSRPRTFEITVREVDAMDVTALVEIAHGNGMAPLRDRAYRAHLRVREQEALEGFREGELSLRVTREALRTAQDARLLDVLELVKDSVDQMQLRYMGRWTSYYIDKYEVMRLVEQLAEDIAHGRTNVERILREGLAPPIPDRATYVTEAPRALRKGKRANNTRSGHTGTEGA